MLVHLDTADNATAAVAVENIIEDIEKRKTDLRHKLERRPTRDELIQHNILKDTKIAPAIQAQASELEKSRLADALEQKITSRPDAKDLLSQGILTREYR
ncbi:hypothetical protein BC938DRAFT_478964 [Jimgerdemannia flammicorona]|uniref:RPEL repeat protein n=2 Tax=Jimgerdemannia flammicorona TaxID=994334 RepID=A0A433QY82_9FUNG|nr:hypothetical protein BC938DRAFT_478964 [Jimgerdemannia flammicorona]